MQVENNLLCSIYNLLSLAPSTSLKPSSSHRSAAPRRFSPTSEDSHDSEMRAYSTSLPPALVCNRANRINPCQMFLSNATLNRTRVASTCVRRSSSMGGGVIIIVMTPAHRRSHLSLRSHCVHSLLSSLPCAASDHRIGKNSRLEDCNSEG